MKLVDDIIDLLSDDSSALGAALLKSQVLAHKLGEKELGAWVEMELRGYPEGTEVPDYRKLSLSVHANISNGYQIANNFALPLFGLDREVLEKVQVKHVRESIAVVEGWVDNPNMTVHFSPHMYGILKKGLSKGFDILSAWGAVPAGAFKETVVEVRSRLLTLMLELSDRLPSEPSAETIRGISRELGVTDLFKGAVLKGNHTINIAVGSNNTVTSTVITNNLQSLADELRKHSVPESDIAELQAAIEGDGESPEHSKGHYGARVRQWFGGMLLKAGTTAWSISTNSAAGAIGAAIAKYYGVS